MTTWYSELSARVEDALASIVSEKQHVALGSEYERELKHQIRAFMHGASLIRDTPPTGDETQTAYLARMIPLLRSIPAATFVSDREDWLIGINRLLANV